MLSFAPPPGEALLPFLVIIGLQWFFPFVPGEATGDAFAASREVMFVVGIDELLPVGLRGLMLTGLLAALASTVDTHLNWGASYWSNDIYQRLIAERWLKRRPGRRELVVVARLSKVVILGIALVVMANLGSIQTAWFISLLFGAGMGAVLVLRWLWERINLYSELAAMAVSLLLAPILLVATDQEWIRLGAMAGLSTLAAVVIAFVTPATDPRVLDAFYRRVEPDGFWRATAARAGLDPAGPVRRLGRALRVTAVTATSLFCLLVGVGQLVIGSPERILWPVGLVVVGLALVPVWARALRPHDITRP
jgi:solute:Na+ symporter, SSS family